MSLEAKSSFEGVLPFIKGNVAVIVATLMIFRFSMSISYYYLTMFLIELGATYEIVGIANGVYKQHLHVRHKCGTSILSSLCTL